MWYQKKRVTGRLKNVISPPFLGRFLHFLGPYITWSIIQPWLQSRAELRVAGNGYQAMYCLKMRADLNLMALTSGYREVLMERECRSAMLSWIQMALGPAYTAHTPWKLHTHMENMEGWSTWGSQFILLEHLRAVTQTAGLVLISHVVEVKKKRH